MYACMSPFSTLFLTLFLTLPPSSLPLLPVGVRHPSSTAAPLNPFARPANSSTAGTSSSFAPSGAAGAGAGGTAGSFRPLGDLDELGTIHGGRLVEREEDDTAATYAAPSPTPVNVHGRNRA